MSNKLSQPAVRVDVVDRALSAPVFARLASLLEWIPMHHVRRTDRDPAAHPLDNYWYYPLVSVPDRFKDDASAAFASLDSMFKPVLDTWSAIQRLVPEGARLYECEFTSNAFGNEGHPHRDCPQIGRRQRHVTAILYCNSDWLIEWGGETVVFDRRNDVMKAVLPRPRRVTLIYGDPLHVARGVARLCPVPRRVLVFKMWLP